MKPLVIAVVPDLFFSMRIESVVESLNYAFKLIETARETKSAPENPGEALHGTEGDLIQLISDQQPGLIIFDIATKEIPWAQWIARLKSSPATRRIPVLAFGSHMDVESMTAAKEAGADPVLARSRFTQELPQLIQKHIRIPDTNAIESACKAALSESGREGIRLFNAGEYFEAHEVLEDAWNADESAAKELYRAILQVAVAYLQIERGNYRGAMKMFLRMRQWFGPLPAVCRGVDVAQLQMDASAVEARVTELGEQKIGELDRELFKPVKLAG